MMPLIGRRRAVTILITGGTGFVGAATVDHCARAGEEVVVLAAHAPEPGWLPAGVEVRLADIRDAQALAAVMRERRPRAVIHGAAITAGPEMERAHPERIVSVNVGGTAAVLQAAAEAGCGRVVICSSASVYPSPRPIPSASASTATRPPRPRSTASPRRWPRRSRRGLARSMA